MVSLESLESVVSVVSVVSVESMFKVISVGGATGGFGDVSANMVTHTAAIAAMRTVLANVWWEKDLFVVLLFIMSFAAGVQWFFKW